MFESPPPFSKLDNLHLTIKGFDLFSILRPEGWRKYFLFGVLISGVAWIVFGYEGCFDQLEHGGKTFLLYLLRSKTWNDVVWIIQYRYGIATHFSALVIYGLMFYSISRYYDKIGIHKSLNLFMSFSLTVFAVSLFEFTWMASYYYAQKQFWVLTPLTRQASILYQNLLFLTAGVFLILFVYGCPMIKFNKSKTLYLLLGLSIGAWLLWYFYPFPITKIQVPVETSSGVVEMWSPSNNFPQTLYTIDLQPYDNNAVGEPFFVEDNLIHSVNLLMKIVWTYTVFYFGKVHYQ